MPSAFVLMPFDEEFDPVYEGFVKPLMEDHGFEVKRADNIESQQNILKDIIEGIVLGNLIVADLTGGNPNGFYELALAHAFRKPVILLTQSIEDVPFDLQSYRLVEYDTHFARIGEAKERLAGYAKGFLDGTTPFGSPVTDFYPESAEANPITGVRSIPTVDARPDDSVNEDALGFLDHLIDVNNGYNRIQEIVASISKLLRGLTNSIATANADLTRVGDYPNASSPAAARNICRRLADRIKSFNQEMMEANAEYSSIAQETENSLEFVVSFQLEQSDLSAPGITEQMTSLRYLRDTVAFARDSQLDLARTMYELPRIERHLNREAARGSEELRVMASNLEKTNASISRALNIFS